MRSAALVMLAAVFAGAATGLARAQEAAAPQEISGAIDRLAFDHPDDPASGATIVVGGTRIVIPAGMNIQLPAMTMTVRELFEQAPPACRSRGESGLATADACRKDSQATPDPAQRVANSDGAQSASNDVVAGAPSAANSAENSAPVAKATVAAARQGADGALTAVAIAITKNIDELFAGVTFVNEEEGYLRVNGPLRKDEGGTLLRINDPTKQQSDQRGPACGTDGNCSPDARFRVDTANLSVRFDRGNPACIGGDAQACPSSNRALPADDTATRMPIRVGDNIRALGAYEIAAGVRFFSAQALVVQSTLPADR